MGLDIKYPIGLMFAILGVLLTIYGFATINDATMYQKSFGINLNLWSGISMTIFGSVMLLLSKKKKA
jgi:hypothetical protein